MTPISSNRSMANVMKTTGLIDDTITSQADGYKLEINDVISSGFVLE
jgi:hypothetical protein